ncbi:sensor histidine kinase [Streptomyces sp. NPDC093093]|uniref:sensor histidine kinase n=1 Tax=Streptomyces sp. NPDC093093 TaxID=3366025 RepID=UPI003800D6CE
MLPGPWPTQLVFRESLVALALAGLAALMEMPGHAGAPQLALTASAAAVLYVLRRGLPGTALVLAAAGSGTLTGITPLLIVTAWSAGHRIARLLPLIGSMALAFALTTPVSFWIGDPAPPKAQVGLRLAFLLLLAVLPALGGRYRAQRRALLTARQERDDQLLRERTMIAHQARLRERQRIAQDMHDSLGHRLALISVHSGALEVDRSLTGSQREAVGVLRQATRAAMRELREVIGVLNEDSAHAATGTANGVGGVDGIDRLTESSRAAGTTVGLSRVGENRPLAAAVDHAAYRIVQEALINAHKHAPGTPISVALRYEPDALVVEVANGPAPEQANPHHTTIVRGQDLTGLHERARLAGGMVHAGPSADGGFRLAAILPYDGAGST